MREIALGVVIKWGLNLVRLLLKLSGKILILKWNRD